jgi:hypothetical protein
MYSSEIDLNKYFFAKLSVSDIKEINKIRSHNNRKQKKKTKNAETFTKQ